MNDLKPCPFCGKPATLVTKHKKLAYFVECESETCSCMAQADEEHEVVKIWNQRPVEDALRTENERLRKLVKSVIDAWYRPNGHLEYSMAVIVVELQREIDGNVGRVYD